jgi:hypothetical protein
MAENNGLLSNQNLDKIFGITPSPAQSLLGNNFDSQKNVATFAPFIAPIMQQGFTPEALLKGFVGAGTARQGVEDRATKNYMTQQDILNATLQAKKLQGDISQQPFQLKSAQAKSILDEGQVQGIKNLLATLPPNKQNELAASGASSYFANNKLTEEERIAYQAFGVDNIFSIPNDKVNLIAEYNNAIPQKEADTINQKEYQKAQDDPTYQPKYVSGKLDFIKNYKQQTEGEAAAKDVAFRYRQKDVPEGSVRLANKKIITQEEFDALPTREQEYLDPSFDITTSRNQQVKVIDGRNKDRGMVRYGLTTTRDVAKNIEKILDDPESLKSLFSTSGRFAVKFNEETKNWFAESGGKAADVANFLNSLKGKQFTEQIQRMRAANTTGGAVGNVSDREVSMFQNMQEYLGTGGSGDNLYEALVDLYDKSKALGQEYKDVYIEDYGDRYWTDTLDKSMHNYKQYSKTFPEALKKQKLNEIGIGNDIQPTQNIFEVISVEDD